MDFGVPVKYTCGLKHAVPQFSHALDGKHRQHIGGHLDANLISDDYGSEWGFTGAFIGLTCQDFFGRRQAVDFDYFEHTERTDGDPA